MKLKEIYMTVCLKTQTNVKFNCQGLDYRQTIPISQCRVNDVCHEISKENLETQGKSEDIPLLVDSDEEIDSGDDTEDENEEYNYDNLKQNNNNKSNETSYSINIYITDARILTEIENILQHYKITYQDYGIKKRLHLNLIKFRTNTNRKSELFKAIKEGIEEIISFNKKSIKWKEKMKSM